MALAQISSQSLFRPLTCRPHLLLSILVGVVAALVVSPWAVRGVTQLLVGWDCGVVTFIGLCMFFMSYADHETLKHRALQHDEAGHFILPLAILASIASVGALVAELSAAKVHSGGEARIALAALTIVLSWLFLQFVFAVHYAHIYYLVEGEKEHRRGLEFGDTAEPDYWDFLHFSLVLGATAQTADIIIRCKRIRRITTLHTLISFGFNTAILATMINLAANLF